MKARSQQGFTLIELIIAIVILGILAALALPKFLNLQRDARISQLAAMEGSMKAAAAIVYGKALASGTVNTNAADEVFAIKSDGVDNVTLDFGYPEGGTDKGIVQVVDYKTTDWTVTNDNTTTTTTFQWKNVTNCRVQYQSAAAAGGRPTITVTNTGC